MIGCSSPRYQTLQIILRTFYHCYMRESLLLLLSSYGRLESYRITVLELNCVFYKNRYICKCIKFAITFYPPSGCDKRTCSATWDFSFHASQLIIQWNGCFWCCFGGTFNLELPKFGSPNVLGFWRLKQFQTFGQKVL